MKALRLVALLATSFFLRNLSLCGADEKPLIVGMDLSYPPFEMRDEKGAPAGFSPDLAHALGEYLHRPVQIENLPFAGLIPALRTGRIDLIISSLTVTPERAKAIDFSEPYLRTGLCLLVGAKSKINNIADADQPGQVVTVVKGTTGHVYATEKIKNARVLVLDQPANCILEIVQGKAEAFLFDQFSVKKFAEKNLETTRALLTPFQEESWAIGIRKGNLPMAATINSFFNEQNQRHRILVLRLKWTGEKQTDGL